MSGGKYDYAYIHLTQLADEVEREALKRRGEYETDWGQTIPGLPPETVEARLDLARSLTLHAAAARAVEWVDSGDWADGEELDPIRAAVDGPHAERARLLARDNLRLQHEADGDTELLTLAFEALLQSAPDLPVTRLLGKTLAGRAVRG